MSESLWNAPMEAIEPDRLRHEIEEPRLRAQLTYVCQHSAFYREKLDASGIRPEELRSLPDLEHFPFTEKSEVRHDQEANPPFGTNLCVSPSDVVRVHRTSGTTGRPLYLALTRHDADIIKECGARAFWCAGLRPDDVVVHCLNYCVWMGGFTDHASLENLGASVVPFGVGNSVLLLETIRHVKATAISCTPSYLSRLAEVARNELHIEPKAVGLKTALCGGEPGLQNPETRRLIEETWGLQAIDANYGLADVLSNFAAECQGRCGLHFLGQGALLVELIDPTTGKVLPITSGQVGEFVYTHLDRQAQPLIRFRSHDMATIAGTEPCGCGRTGFRFKIVGRSDDMLHVKGINVFPTAIGDVIASFSPEVTGEYQVVLHGPGPYQHLHLRVEYIGPEGADTLAALKARIRKKLRELQSFSAEIELVPGGTLLRSDDKSKRVVKLYEQGGGS